MSLPNSQSSLERVVDVLAYARKKGVKFWSEDGQLCFRAPKGALTPEEVDRLRASKGQIIALLGQDHTGGTPENLPSSAGLDRAPLTYSQVAHWNLSQLNKRPGIRQIASVTRMNGSLNLDALRRAASEVVRRHDALRTRIVLVDGVQIQKVLQSESCEILAVNPSAAGRASDIQRQIEQLIMEPVDLAAGPLITVRLLRLSQDEHVLLVAMEHIIADAYSMNIFVRELFAAYEQAARGQTFDLPPITKQFPDYAVLQSNLQPAWKRQHGAYWEQQLAACRRLRFPADHESCEGAGWGSVAVHIGKELKAELVEWSRARQTTLVMTIFAAYVALVLRWCNECDMVIRYQTDGRADPEIANTIGYFATGIYLRIQLFQTDRFVDLVQRVTAEYCAAYEHADASYFEAQTPRPEFTRGSGFNWVPLRRNVNLGTSEATQSTLTCSSILFEHPMMRTLELDAEPVMMLRDPEDEIEGCVYFPRSRFSATFMARFERNFQLFIRKLVSEPGARVKAIDLV